MFIELFTCFYDRVEFTESVIVFFMQHYVIQQPPTHTVPAVQLVCLNEEPKNYLLVTAAEM